MLQQHRFWFGEAVRLVRPPTSFLIHYELRNCDSPMRCQFILQHEKLISEAAWSLHHVRETVNEKYHPTEIQTDRLLQQFCQYSYSKVEISLFLSTTLVVLQEQSARCVCVNMSADDNFQTEWLLTYSVRAQETRFYVDQPQSDSNKCFLRWQRVLSE